nr:hypothetical protein [Tanacetum cinerariifolium]
AAGSSRQQGGLFTAAAGGVTGYCSQHGGVCLAAEQQQHYMGCLFGAAEQQQQYMGCLFGCRQQYRRCLFGLPTAATIRACLFGCRDTAANKGAFVWAADSSRHKGVFVWLPTAARERLFGLPTAASKGRVCF